VGRDPSRSVVGEGTPSIRFPACISLLPIANQFHFEVKLPEGIFVANKALSNNLLLDLEDIDDANVLATVRFGFRTSRFYAIETPYEPVFSLIVTFVPSSPKIVY
jgi:hypothetical protein